MPSAPPSAILTGGSTGIGRALALQLAERGFSLTLAARDLEALEAAAAAARSAAPDPQQRVVCHPTDVTDALACRALVDEHLERHGGTLDTLVICAGAGHHGLCTDDDLEIHRTLMDVNYFGAVHCIQAALPALIAPEREAAGRLLVVGSLSGEVGLPLRSAYCASKHALSGYLDSIRLELKMRSIPLQITNCAPTSVNTEFHKQGRHGPPPSMGPEACAAACMAAYDSGGGTAFIPGYQKALTLLPTGLADGLIARHERKLLDGVLEASRL